MIKYVWTYQVELEAENVEHAQIAIEEAINASMIDEDGIFWKQHINYE